MALRSLLHLASTEARELKEFCSLDQVLETIRVQLEALTLDEDLADFARDVETLRREVQSLFHQKLEQVPFLVYIRLAGAGFLQGRLVLTVEPVLYYY